MDAAALVQRGICATGCVQWLDRGCVNAAQIECYCVNVNIAIV